MDKIIELPLWAVIAAGAVLLGLIIAVIVLAVKLSKSRPATKAGDLKIIDGVRYTISSEGLEGGKAVVTHQKGDIVLTCGQTYTAGKRNDFMPGKYIVLTATEGVNKFNVRLGEYVREVCHMDAIVLDEDEKITPVSHSIILR